jgi:hypothetical protein
MQLSIFSAILLYLDPGTGSIILQAVAAAFAGAAIAVRFYWKRILRLFGVRKEEEETPVENTENRE